MYYVETPAISSTIDVMKTTVWGESGFPARFLADICDAVLEAREAGMLDSQQTRLAQRCELLVRGFARIGIIALVDEATGYQRIREERALAKLRFWKGL